MDLKTAERKLDTLYKKREEVLPTQRKIVMKCAGAIRKVHIGNVAEAKKDAKEIKSMITKLEKKIGNHHQLQKFLSTPYQEYVELEVLLSVMSAGKMPKISVPADAYLLGAQDAIGELKRVCMELLAEGKRKEAMILFKRMEKIYYSMQGYAFPNSLVPGFKHKQDAMKGVLEKLHHTLSEARMR